LKAKDKVSKISGVLISLLVLHGPARFDELFTGTNAVAFANWLDPQRDKMFSASERIPTGTALSCLRAATDLSRVFSKPKNSANKRHLLIKSLQDSMLRDDITKFRVLDDTAIQKLVDLICTMDNWTFPRNLLLGENKESGNGKTYSRELDFDGRNLRVRVHDRRGKLQVERLVLSCRTGPRRSCGHDDRHLTNLRSRKRSGLIY